MSIEVDVGSTFPRLRLKGEANGTNDALVSITGFEVYIRGEDSPDFRQSLFSVDIEEQELVTPLPFTGTNLDVGLPPILILEGPEEPGERLLFAFNISGWKLELGEEDGDGFYRLTLPADLGFSTHPGYFPGATRGEVVLHSFYAVDLALEFSVPWPLSGSSKLEFSGVDFARGIGELSDVRHWTLPIFSVENILDSAGDILKDNLLGNLKLGAEARLEAIAPHGALNPDSYTLRFVIATKVQSPPEPLISLWGADLLLDGSSSLVVQATIETGAPDPGPGFPRLHVTAFLDLNLAGRLQFELPLMRKITDPIAGIVADSKEMVEMLGVEGDPEILSVPEIPRLQLDFGTASPTQSHVVLLDVSFPLSFDGSLLASTVQTIKEAIFNLLAGRAFTLSGLEKLEGKCFRACFSRNGPVVILGIKEANPRADGKPGMDLVIKLSVELVRGVEESKMVFNGKWGFVFDLATFSFIPDEKIDIDVENRTKTIVGIQFSFPDRILVDWSGKGLVLTFYNMEALFKKGADPRDEGGGLKLTAPYLRIGSAGVDCHLTLLSTSGMIPLGIGKMFKAVKGEIVFQASDVRSATLFLTGPVPFLDNKTVTAEFKFGPALRVIEIFAIYEPDNAKVAKLGLEFQISVIRFGIFREQEDSDDFSVGVFLTGSVSIIGTTDERFSLLNYFKDFRLEFEELPITEDGIGLPRSVQTFKKLSKPVNIGVLKVFGFELRGIGIVPAKDIRDIKFVVAGELQFGENQQSDPRADFHKMFISPPPEGSILPRVSFDGLSLHYKKDPVEIRGEVGFFDDADRKGFSGGGKLLIGESLGMDVSMEVLRVDRADGQSVRVWMLLAEIENANLKLMGDIYLRDIAAGFGLRKNFTLLDNPNLLLASPGKSFESISVGKPTDWEDKLEPGPGGDPIWTAALQAWMTVTMPKARSASVPLVGELLLSVRSDLTFLMALRFWALSSLDSVKGGKSAHPIAIGTAYYNVREKHLLLALIADARNSPPEGVPPPIVNAFLSPPFTFVFETSPTIFRLELAWPREFRFRVGVYTGFCGILVRKAPGALTIGLGFELGYVYEFKYEASVGFATLFINAKGSLTAFGEILARIGDGAALYGTVGINAYLKVSAGLRIRIKLFFTRITITYKIDFEFAATARVTFGIMGDGFGMEGYASVSLRIWKYSLSASIAFVVNKAILDKARKLVTEGTSLAQLPATAGPEDGLVTRRELPWGVLPVPGLFDSPVLGLQWTLLPVRKENFVYVLALPRRGGFATPELSEAPVTGARWKLAAGAAKDYTYTINQTGTNLIFPQSSLVFGFESGMYVHRLEWNEEIPEDQDPIGHEHLFDRNAADHDPDDSTCLGDWFAEPLFVHDQIKILERLIEKVTPELLEDWRVRAESELDAFENPLNLRPDTRSPAFESHGSLYDAALEVAMSRKPDEILSQVKTAIALTTWVQDFIDRNSLSPDGLTGDELSFIRFIAEIEPEDIPRDTDEDAKRFDFRTRMLDGAERLVQNRANLIAKLIQSFQNWVADETTRPSPMRDAPEDDFLRLSGLAFKFEITDPDNSPPWSIEFEQIQLHRTTYASLEPVSNISNGRITEDHLENGLGFNQDEFRLRDAQEFQDAQGLNLIWELLYEFDGTAYPYSRREMAGLIQAPPDLVPDSLPDIKDDPFEFFDHFEVIRTNLSAREDQIVNKTFRAKPVFIPTLVEDPSAEAGQSFFLLAPRFDFTDNFEDRDENGVNEEEPDALPVRVGDRLLYTITAVDLFGNRTRSLQHYGVRKSFLTPPAPEKGRVLYTAMLGSWSAALAGAPGEVRETVHIGITPHRNAAAFEAGPLQYEVWARSIPIRTEGFYGQGNSALDPLKDKDEPVIRPKGMFLVHRGAALSLDLPPATIQGLPLGQAHEFYVRAVNPEGLASRLMRCEHAARTESLAGSPSLSMDRSQPNLERIPPVFDGMEAWLANAALRGEAGPASEPVIGADGALTQGPASDGEERDVTLRILHRAHLDLGKAHPTGGYRIHFRDRDETLGSDGEGDILPENPGDFQVVAQMEVLSEDRFRRSPPNASQEEKWRINLVPQGAGEEQRPLPPGISALDAALDPDRLGFPVLDWGGEETDFSVQRAAPRVDVPRNWNPHPDLRELLEVMRDQMDGGGPFADVEVLDGLPAQSEMEGASIASVLAGQKPDRDPAELGLLRRMGRAVDVALVLRPGFVLNVAETQDFMRGVYEEAAFLNHRIRVVVLRNADRATDMAYFRLALEPVIRIVATGDPELPPPLSPAQPLFSPRDSFDLELAASFLKFRRNFKARGYQTDTDATGKFLENSDKNGSLSDYIALSDRMLSKRSLAAPGIAFGAGYFTDKGDLARPLEADGTIALQIFYKDPLARRFAYQIKRQSRYINLYRELGLIDDYSPGFELPGSPAGRIESLKLRLPRVRIPDPPSLTFLGQVFAPRTGGEADDSFVSYSEWSIGEHAEEAKVRANETLRNRLGYRGVAWSLFASTDRNWLIQSGWNPDANPDTEGNLPTASPTPDPDRTWFERSTEAGDGGLPGFLEPGSGTTLDTDAIALFRRAEWPDVKQEDSDEPLLDCGAALGDPPFRGLLEPKATVIRVPALPYYYTFRLAAFCRTDDLDSVAVVSEANTLFPSVVPQLDLDKAGWQVSTDQGGVAGGHTRLDLWWEAPSVWESLTEREQALWPNEMEFATRLWDFELQFTVQIQYQGTVFPLATVAYDRQLSLAQGGDDSPPVEPTPSPVAEYTGQTTGSHLYLSAPGEAENLIVEGFPSYFVPRLSFQAIADETLTRYLNTGRFKFEVKVFRDRGPGRPVLSFISEKLMP